ncbi:heavy metal-associated isoprenylated plant protein 32 [Abeliophyllum distichum]|uniref:Heavy metal-associated isoprenylated plant protein 32 n=1 Tax=Abeliophyllum distichum TaxID=126358 RepID=A0ABD1SHD5_9LAMI
MEPYANLCCILKVNIRCDACKRKTLEVLNSICGVYSVTISAEEGTAKISGEVDPNLCLSALARTGQHAELVWAKLNHPRLDRGGYYNDHDYHNGLHKSNYGYGYPRHGLISEPYWHRSGLPGGMWRDSYQHYPLSRALPEYSSYNSNYYNDASRMPIGGRYFS